jgi:AP-1-like factor
MAAGQYDSSDNQAYMMTPEMSAAMYDGTSSESSASSPLNCNVSAHPLHVALQYAKIASQGFDNLYAAFPMQYPMSGDGMAPLGLIPVELDIEGLYEDHDRRRRKGSSDKVVSSHVHSVSISIAFLTHMTDSLLASPSPEPRITTGFQR